jgi:hypothetical protein
VVVGRRARWHEFVGEPLARDRPVDVEADEHPDVAAFTRRATRLEGCESGVEQRFDRAERVGVLERYRCDTVLRTASRSVRTVAQAFIVAVPSACGSHAGDPVDGKFDIVNWSG